MAGFLTELRTSLKDRSLRPVPVRTVLIPKTNGKRRSLGIPTLRDGVVQASLRLVLERILEADFNPSSYGFRPERRCQDSIEEIRFYAPRGYEQSSSATSRHISTKFAPGPDGPAAASCD